MGVPLLVERLIVTLALFALFAVLKLTHNMDAQTEGILGPAIGAVIVAWLNGHMSQQSQQSTKVEATVKTDTARPPT